MLKGVPTCLGFGMCASFCFPVLASGLDDVSWVKLLDKVTNFLGHLCPGLAPHAAP